MRRRQLLLAGSQLAAALTATRLGRAAESHGPKPLEPGARIAALAPGTWLDPDEPTLLRLQERCRARGWQLQTPHELMGRWRWFSGTDQVRCHALQAAWMDPTISALFCVGAGWGSARLLEQSCWTPSRSPRWCVGFSDCSALLLAQWAAGSSGGIHAGFTGSQQQWERLALLLEGGAVEPLRGRPRQGGVAVGPLVVSNLSIATSLIGTPWLPDLRGCVLVLEDTGEAPYRIDRMLTQWRSSGLLEGIAGLGLGRFRWAQDDVLPGDFSMDEILVERLAPLGVPLVSDLPVGHGQPNLALPLGRQARLDGHRGELELL